MASKLEALHREAQSLFLGKGAVIGIGIAAEAGTGLLEFLLSENLPHTRREVEAWATRNNVGVEFLTTGPIRMGGSN
jgi:hypothetical protein